MNPNSIILSHATYTGASGATGAATYAFMTKRYQPPAQPRDIDFDEVHNQNGRFKYVYDNGPGFKRWPAFTVTCQDAFQSLLGANAITQYAHLLEMWNYKGVLGMETPEGIYSVHWAKEAAENAFIMFPNQVGDKIEMDVTVTFEEA